MGDRLQYDFGPVSVSIVVCRASLVVVVVWVWRRQIVAFANVREFVQMVDVGRRYRTHRWDGLIIQPNSTSTLCVCMLTVELYCTMADPCDY